MAAFFSLLLALLGSERLMRVDILGGRVSRFVSSLDGAPTLAVSFFGFGLCRKWSSWAVASALASSSHAAVIGDSVDLAGMVALLVVALIAGKTKPLCHSGWLVCTLAFVLSIGTLLLSWAAPHGQFVLAVVGGIAMAVGRSVFWLAWFELFGCLPPAKIAYAYAGSIILCTVLWPALSAVSGWALAFFVAIIPLISFVMLYSSWLKIADVHTPSQAGFRDMSVSFWKLAVWVAAASLCYGFTAVAASGHGWVELFGRLVPNLMVILGIIFVGSRFDIDRVYQLAVPMTTIGMLLCFTQLRGSGIDGFVASMGEECVNIVFFVVACGLGYRRGVSAATLCGVLFFVRSVSVYVGEKLSAALPDAAIVFAYGSALVLFLMCSFLIFRNDDLLGMWDITGMNIGNAQDGNAISSRVSQISVEYDLSERERAVLICMAKGLKNDEIASELFIAPGTVRAHMSRIYGKLGVHSRSEVDGLILDRA